MADTRERWEVERDDFESGKSGRDIEDELESLLDADEDDEDAEADDEAAGSEDDGADLVLGFADEYAVGKASADADAAAFRAQVDANMPNSQPAPPPLSRMEEAAVAAAKFPPGSPEFEALKARMAAANEEMWRKARASEPGFDEAGEEVLPPFNPMDLPPADFNTFMQAVASGGANPRVTPAGFTRETWAQAVKSAITGRG